MLISIVQSGFMAITNYEDTEVTVAFDSLIDFFLSLVHSQRKLLQKAKNSIIASETILNIFRFIFVFSYIRLP